MDHITISLDDQIWPLPASGKRVARLGRRANPREVAEGKGHRLWVAAAWVAECRGQGAARAAQGAGENKGKIGGPGD